MVTFRNKARRDPEACGQTLNLGESLGVYMEEAQKERRSYLKNSPTLKLPPSSTYTQTDTNTHTGPSVKQLSPTSHDLPQWFVWPGPRIPQGLAPDHIPLEPRVAESSLLPPWSPTHLAELGTTGFLADS